MAINNVLVICSVFFVPSITNILHADGERLLQALDDDDLEFLLKVLKDGTDYKLPTACTPQERKVYRLFKSKRYVLQQFKDRLSDETNEGIKSLPYNVIAPGFFTFETQLAARNKYTLCNDR